jgi:phosphatidylserine decarboxylase
MESVLTVLQALLPQHLLSRAAGWLATLERPSWLKDQFIRRFASHYGIDLSEAECDDFARFEHFNAFFTRALRQDARPLAVSDWCQPADGVLSQRGAMANGELIQAKGRQYSVQALLAGSKKEAERFARGSFATTYLSPRDYHRVHMPMAGRLLYTRYVPGDLFSVNAATVERVDQLLARNERLVCVFDTEHGQVALVLVGAMIVAGIATVWGGREVPGTGAIRECSWTESEAPRLAKGEEMGRFFLGSTTVLLTEASDLSWANAPGDSVRVRAALAH